MNKSPRWLLPLLLVLFFGSGACALVYQVMWLRLLSLIFGVTVYAASTVLAGFMAGLALGSYASGRLAARVTRPLAAFGAAEVLVGATALASPVVLDQLRDLWIALHPSLPQSLTVLTAARFIVALLVLIVPTSFMGATLPLVVKSALARRSRMSGRVGLLFAVNTAGAIAGALVAGFYFISDIGVAQSFRIAAATNLLIGVVAIAAGFALPADPTPIEVTADDPDAAVKDVTPVQRQAVLWTFFLSGLMSLALEVIWFRMLVLFLRPTAYAFTIMLATVLFGIAAGSALVAPILRLKTRRLPLLAVLQALTGLAAVVSFNTISSTQKIWEAVLPSFESAGLNSYLVPIIVSSVVAMLPTALLLGAAFPLGLAIWAGDGINHGTTRRVGVFYSLNVVGAIIGSSISGLVLLPGLGSQNSLRLMSALAVVSAVVLALSQVKDRRVFALATAVGATLLFAVAAIRAVDPFDVAFERFHRGEKLVWRTEGAQTTVAVHDRYDMRIMYLDGRQQANDSAGTAFVHHRIGALPVMLHPHPTTALVLGLGGGATPGAVARLGVDVDVVELSKGVVDGSDFFKRINFDLLQRPNVHLRVDDGRNFLLTNRKKYDVVTADVILPRHAGASSLYSKEYYELVRASLAEGGLVMQWNGAETASEYRLMARTFQSVFPYTTLWADGSLMLGSLRPFTLSRSTWEAKRNLPGFADFLNWDLFQLNRIYSAGPDAMRKFVGDGPLLSDDKPVLEYFLSLPKNDAPGEYSWPKADLKEILVP